MQNNKLFTPDGFNDCLPEAYALKSLTQQRIGSVFESFGYRAVSGPTLEYTDVFEAAPTKYMYRFIDRHGDILVLRPDMTPQIARIVANHFNEADMPLRLCYTQNAFRCNDSYKGHPGEYTESGVELIGQNTASADAEVIVMSIKALLAAGVDDFTVYAGDVRFLAGLMDEAGLEAGPRAEYIDLLARRDYVAAEALLSDICDARACSSSATILKSASELIGGLEVLHRAAGLTRSPKAHAALQSLSAIYDIVDMYGLSKYIVFDLNMTANMDYYTGLLFRGLSKDIGFSLFDGGRYDDLLSTFGVNLPAVGFSLKIDDLLSVLRRNNTVAAPTAHIERISHGADRDSLRHAIETAEALRKDGHIAVLDL